MKYVVLVFASLLSMTASVCAEDSPFDRYTPNTLHAIIELHATAAEGTDILLSAKDFASSVPVTFLGELRTIPTWRRDFLDKYFISQQMTQYRELLESEVLVEEGGRKHWLPIQKPLLSAFNDEVKKGSKVTLYVTWLGAVKHGGDYEWLFSINEFKASESQ